MGPRAVGRAQRVTERPTRTPLLDLCEPRKPAPQDFAGPLLLGILSEQKAMRAQPEAWVDDPLPFGHS
jgi:hypothetical protein